MNIYEYLGPEAALRSCLTTVRQMTIREIENKGDQGFIAHGRFTFYDHVEGAEGENPWIATGTVSGDKVVWTVRRKDPGPREVVFCGPEPDNEPLFCLDGATNTAIKAFIANKLEFARLQLKGKPETEQIIEKPEPFAGTKKAYQGRCVCQMLQTSFLAKPFDWMKYTENGKYPAHCFECSCGRWWYRFDPSRELWGMVVDQETWFLLSHFNGVAVESLSLDPKYQIPVLILTRTLRERGLIPMG